MLRDLGPQEHGSSFDFCVHKERGWITGSSKKEGAGQSGILGSQQGGLGVGWISLSAKEEGPGGSHPSVPRGETEQRTPGSSTAGGRGADSLILDGGGAGRPRSWALTTNLRPPPGHVARRVDVSSGSSYLYPHRLPL